MAKVPPSKLYNHYYIDRKFERLNLFRQLEQKYGGKRVLYPGSFVHVTPSFVYPDVVYVDNDKEANPFFDNPSNYDFVNKRKHYTEKPTITFHAVDYQTGIDEPDQSFDLLISLFAGFVSLHCKRYLKVGGLLLVNDSHGDASMAWLDKDFQLIQFANQTEGKYTLSDMYLDTYFVTRADTDLTREWVMRHLRGFKYRRMADVYLFQRIK
jgi:hypothetical protein